MDPNLYERLSDVSDEKMPVKSRFTRKNYLITDFFTKIEEVNKTTFLEPPIAESKLHGLVSNFHVLSFSI